MLSAVKVIFKFLSTLKRRQQQVLMMNKENSKRSEKVMIHMVPSTAKEDGICRFQAAILW